MNLITIFISKTGGYTL